MKAKIKLKLKDYPVCPYLKMYIKLENEHFYNHNYLVMNIMERRFESREEFINELYDFLSNKETIIITAQEVVKNILKDKLISINTYSKETEIRKILKELKKPIEIEIKE